MEIKIEQLRKDLIEEFDAAFLAGGIGSALVEAAEAEHASPEQLIRMAQQMGWDLSKYAR